MTDEPERPKVINIFNRAEYRPEQTPPAVDGVDELSMAALQVAIEMVQNGSLVGVCIAGLDPVIGQPLTWTQFPPGSNPRRAALEYVGVMDLLKDHLKEVAVYGLEELAQIALEQGDPDDDGYPG